MFQRVEAFYRPESVADAVRLLERGKGHARIVAGGTDVVVEGAGSARILIDLTRAGLTYIRKRDSVCVIGATTTLSELEASTAIRALAGGLLSRAAATCGSVQVRNTATLGGNLAHGSPAADMTTALLLLNPSVVLVGPQGRRKVELAEYLKQARANQLASTIVTEIVIPEQPRGSRSGWSFQKFGRTEVDISLVCVAAALELDSRARVKWIRLALGAVAEFPFRAFPAEQLLTGRAFDRNWLAEAGEAVTREVQPISDVRAPAELRRELSRVMTMRALEECAVQAGCCL